MVPKKIRKVAVKTAKRRLVVRPKAQRRKIATDTTAKSSFLSSIVHSLAQKGKQVADYLRNVLHRGDIVPVTGFGFAQGIAMRSDHYIAVAVPSINGYPQVISAHVHRDSLQTMPLMHYPVLRGLHQLVENTSIVLFLQSQIRRMRRQEEATRPFPGRASERMYALSRGVIVFFLAIGLLQYLFIQMQSFAVHDIGLTFKAFLSVLIGIVIFLLLFGLMVSIPSGNVEMLAYQRAQHALVHAYMSREKMTLKYLMSLEVSYDRPVLAQVFWTVVILSLFLVVLNVHTISIVVAFFMILGLAALSYALAFELVHALVRREGGFWFSILITPLVFLQQAIFQKPEERHLFVGMAALEEVVRLEKQHAAQ